MSDETTETWPRVIVLKHPIQFGSERITQLTMRRGKAGDMKGITIRKDSVATNDLIRIASKLSGMETQVIEELDVEDAGEVMEVALDFFAMYLTAGKKRSP